MAKVPRKAQKPVDDMGKLNSDIASEFDIDVDQPTGKGRRVATASKTVGSLIYSTAEGMAKGSVNELRTQFPKTAGIIDEAFTAVGDIRDLKNEIANEVGPAWNSLKGITLKMMPMTKLLMPQSLYKKIETKLKESYEPVDGRTAAQKQADERQNAINGQIAEIFQTQLAAQQNAQATDQAEKHVDRVLRRVEFKADQQAFASLDAKLTAMHQFMSGSLTAYMKKSLELKYHHLYVAKDVFSTVRVLTKIVEARLEEIKHNTGLPDYAKTTMKERVFGHMKDKAAKGFNDFFGSITKNLKEYALDNVRNVTKNIIPMFASFADMSDMMGPLTKTQVAGSALGFVGRIVSQILTGQIVDAKGENLLRLDRSLANADAAAKLALMRARKNKGGEGWTQFLPDSKKATTIHDTSAESPDQGVAFDMLTRDAIVSVIPKHLSYIGSMLMGVVKTVSPTYDFRDKKNWMNVNTRTKDFESVADTENFVITEALGTEAERASRMTDMLATTSAIAKRSGKFEPDEVTKFSSDTFQSYLAVMIQNCSDVDHYFDPVMIKNAYEARQVGEIYRSVALNNAFKGIPLEYQTLIVDYFYRFMYPNGVEDPLAVGKFQETFLRFSEDDDPIETLETLRNKYGMDVSMLRDSRTGKLDSAKKQRYTRIHKTSSEEYKSAESSEAYNLSINDKRLAELKERNSGESEGAKSVRAIISKYANNDLLASEIPPVAMEILSKLVSGGEKVKTYIKSTKDKVDDIFMSEEEKLYKQFVEEGDIEAANKQKKKLGLLTKAKLTATTTGKNVVNGVKKETEDIGFKVVSISVATNGEVLVVTTTKSLEAIGRTVVVAVDNDNPGGVPSWDTVCATIVNQPFFKEFKDSIEKYGAKSYAIAAKSAKFGVKREFVGVGGILTSDTKVAKDFSSDIASEYSAYTAVDTAVTATIPGLLTDILKALGGRPSKPRKRRAATRKTKASSTTTETGSASVTASTASEYTYGATSSSVSDDAYGVDSLSANYSVGAPITDEFGEEVAEGTSAGPAKPTYTRLVDRDAYKQMNPAERKQFAGLLKKYRTLEANKASHKKLEKARENINEFVKIVYSKRIKEKITAATEQAAKIAKNKANQAKHMTGGIVRTTGDLFTETVMPTASTVANKGMETFKELRDKLGDKPQIIWEQIKSGFGQMKSGFKDSWGTFKAAFKRGSKSEDKPVEESTDKYEEPKGIFGKAAAKIKSLFKMEKDIFKGAPPPESGFHADFRLFANKALTALSKVKGGRGGGILERTIAGIANVGKGVGTLTGGILRGYGRALGGIGRFVGGAVGGLAKGVGSTAGAIIPSVVSGAGSAIGGLAKGYGTAFKWVGEKAWETAKGIGGAVPGVFRGLNKGLNAFFGGMLSKPKFVDIYLKDKVEPGNPLLSAKRQEEGVSFEDGTKVEKSSDINKPVFGMEDGEKKCLITKDDIKQGLVNVDNKPIASIGGKLGDFLDNLGWGGKVLHLMGKGVKAATGIWGNILSALGIGMRGAAKVGTTLIGRLFGIEGRDFTIHHAGVIDRLDKIIMIMQGGTPDGKNASEKVSSTDLNREGSAADQKRDAEEKAAKIKADQDEKKRVREESTRKHKERMSALEEEENGANGPRGAVQGVGNSRIGSYIRTAGNYVGNKFGTVGKYVGGKFTSLAGKVAPHLTKFGGVAKSALLTGGRSALALATNPVGLAILGSAAAALSIYKGVKGASKAATKKNLGIKEGIGVQDRMASGLSQALTLGLGGKRAAKFTRKLLDYSPGMAIIKAFMGDKDAMTDKEIQKFRARCENKIKKGLPGYDKILARFNKAVRMEDWPTARAISGNETNILKTLVSPITNFSKDISGLLFGNDETAMKPGQIKAFQQKLQEKINKGDNIAKKKLEKFNDAIREQDWKKARAIAGMGDTGILNRSYSNRALAFLGPAFWLIDSFKDPKNKPLTNKEIREFQKHCAKLGTPQAQKILQKFNNAVEGEDWKTARALSGKKGQTFLDAVSSRAAKNVISSLDVITFGAFNYSDQDKPLTDKEINDYRAKMQHRIKKGSKSASNVLEKFEEAVAQQQWKKARAISKIKDKAFWDEGGTGRKITRYLLDPHNLWGIRDTDDDPLKPEEISKFQESMMRKIKLGDKSAQRKLDAFNDAIVEQKWKRARAISKIHTEGKIWKAEKSVFNWVAGIYGSETKPMDAREITEFRDKMNDAIKNGDPTAQRKLDMFEDAVQDQNWKKARRISGVKNEFIYKKAAKYTWRYLFGSDEEPMTDSEIKQFQDKMEDAIASGKDPNARVKLEQFNNAVANQLWKKARRISEMKDYGIIGNTAKKVWNFYTGKKDYNDVVEVKEKLEKIIGEEDDPVRASQLQKIADRVQALSNQGLYDDAVRIGEDGLNIIGDLKGAAMTGMSRDDIKDYTKAAQRGQDILKNIAKSREKYNWLTSPIIVARLSRLRSKMESSAGSWTNEILDQFEEELLDIDENAEITSADNYKEDANAEKVIKIRNALLDKVKKEDANRWWLGSPLLKSRLKSYITELENTPPSEMFDKGNKWIKSIYDRIANEKDIKNNVGKRASSKEITAKARVKLTAENAKAAKAPSNPEDAKAVKEFKKKLKDNPDYKPKDEGEWIAAAFVANEKQKDNVVQPDTVPTLSAAEKVALLVDAKKAVGVKAFEGEIRDSTIVGAGYRRFKSLFSDDRPTDLNTTSSGQDIWFSKMMSSSKAKSDILGSETADAVSQLMGSNRSDRETSGEGDVVSLLSRIADATEQTVDAVYSSGEMTSQGITNAQNNAIAHSARFTSEAMARNKQRPKEPPLKRSPINLVKAMA